MGHDNVTKAVSKQKVFEIAIRLLEDDCIAKSGVERANCYIGLAKCDDMAPLVAGKMRELNNPEKLFGTDNGLPVYSVGKKRDVADTFIGWIDRTKHEKYLSCLIKKAEGIPYDTIMSSLFGLGMGGVLLGSYMTLFTFGVEALFITAIGFVTVGSAMILASMIILL